MISWGLLNQISICYYCSQLYELHHIVKGYINCHYVTILTCVLVTKQQHRHFSVFAYGPTFLQSSNKNFCVFHYGIYECVVSQESRIISIDQQLKCLSHLTSVLPGNVDRAFSVLLYCTRMSDVCSYENGPLRVGSVCVGTGSVGRPSHVKQAADHYRLRWYKAYGNGLWETCVLRFRTQVFMGP
jgi:hypothetical protein